MSKRVLIINTRAGNLFSLRAAIERLGFEVTIADQADKAESRVFDSIVIPGQGRFGTVMQHLEADGWIDYLNQQKQSGQRIFGICVGMQIFFQCSEEDPGVKGLCWLSGKVIKPDFPKKPMVGWAPLSSPIWPDQIVYFVNSFAVKHSEQMIASTDYGESFCAAVRDKNIFGVQFHPEKSGQTGSELMGQILRGELDE